VLCDFTIFFVFWDFAIFFCVLGFGNFFVFWNFAIFLCFGILQFFLCFVRTTAWCVALSKKDAREGKVPSVGKP